MPDQKGRLTHKESTFIEAMAATGDREYAAVKAGYPHPRPAASRNLAHPVISAEIRKRQQDTLQGPLRDAALKLLGDVLGDERQSTRDRLTASKIVLDKTDQAPEEAAERDLASMTAAELEAHLTKAQAALAQREASMVDITPHRTIEPEKALDAQVTPGVFD